VGSLRQIINSTKELVKTSREMAASQAPEPKLEEDELEDEPSAAPSPSISAFHIDESLLTNLENVVSEVETWLKDKTTAQEKLKLWQEPVLLVADLQRKGDQIQAALRKLLLEQSKPRTKSKTTSSISTSSTSSPSESVASLADESTTLSASISTASPAEEVPLYTEVSEDSDTIYTTTATVTSIIIEDEPEATTGSILHEEL
jgi:hypothetical protein